MMLKMSDGLQIFLLSIEAIVMKYDKVEYQRVYTFT